MQKCQAELLLLLPQRCWWGRRVWWGQDDGYLRACLCAHALRQCSRSFIAWWNPASQPATVVGRDTDVLVVWLKFSAFVVGSSRHCLPSSLGWDSCFLHFLGNNLTLFQLSFLNVAVEPFGLRPDIFIHEGIDYYYLLIIIVWQISPNQNYGPIILGSDSAQNQNVVLPNNFIVLFCFIEWS